VHAGSSTLRLSATLPCVRGSSVDVISAPPFEGVVRSGLGRAVHVGVTAPSVPQSGSIKPSFGVPPGSVPLEARVQLPYDN